MSADSTDDPDVVVFGNLIVDDIVYPNGRARMQQAGGAVAHFALGAALWGCSVGIVSVVGNDYPDDILRRLAERRIMLDGVRHLDGPGMRTWLLHEDDRRRVIHRLGSPSHDDGSPDVVDMPQFWAPKAIHLAPMPLDRQDRLLKFLRSATSAVLSVDPYVLMDESTWDASTEVFSQADLLLVGNDEILLGTGANVGARWATSGIPTMLHKQGKAGGIVYTNVRSHVLRWEGRARRVTDPTGAGDAFAGGLLAALSRGEVIEEALKKAVVSAAITLECVGLEAMLDMAPEEASARYDEWFPHGAGTDDKSSSHDL